jgi:GMP synthase-like glutamine amidotransferase
MSTAVILQHVPFEGPGRIVPVFRDFGIPIDIRHLYRGDPLPENLDDIRILIIMGGPMGVADIGKPEYPFLAGEVTLLKRMIAEDRPVLGICLGAQLLAHAAGAKVYPNTKPPANPGDPPVPAPEIGWGGITLPFPGGTEPIVMGLMNDAPMFHWHFDTFDLPKLPTPPPTPPGAPPSTGCVLIASTRTCKNQAYRFKNRLFGFQFHFEMDPTGIEAMLAHGQETITKVLGPEGPKKILEDTARYYAQNERLGNRILRNLVQFLKLY